MYLAVNNALGTTARRVENQKTALTLAAVGAFVFVSSGKTPLIPRYTQADTAITAEDREAAIEEYEARHGKKPVHVGATTNAEVIKKLFRRFPDGITSVSCGPSKLVVIDADVKESGPDKIRALFDAIGWPENTVASPTQSGGLHLIFSDPDGKFTNKAGLLKKDYGCDLRGRGGQFVAPGSIREDGKTYGTAEDRVAFARRFKEGSFPQLPPRVVELIGTSDVEREDVKPSQEREIIKQLEDGDCDIADAEWNELGEYSVDQLKTLNHEFKQLYDNPSSDCSTNRFKITRMVMAQWPQMSPPALASFLSTWEGSGAWTEDKPKSGEYDNRQIAREWLKNQGLAKPSDGAALDAIDEDDEPEVAKPLSTKSKLADRFVYIADIRAATLRFLDWCLKFVIARGTTSMVTGMWGSGKTAVFSDIGLHVGHGFDWRGRKVTQGVVLYVALENSEDVERRVATWCDLMARAGRDVSNGAFVVYRGPCRLFDPNGRPTQDEKDLIELAKTAAAHYGLPVAMIVIDTLAQSIAPGDDNSAKDAGIYTAAMQRIVLATGANVTALAHPTKAGEGVRGSGALVANVDTVIEISRDALGRGTIKAGSKFRIGNPSKVRFGYRLQSHVIGRDPDGDDIDVVLAVEAATRDMAITEDDDVPLLKVSDRREDRVSMLLDAAREQAEKLAADEEPVSAVGLTAATLRDAMNARRLQFCGLDGKPLAPLNREGVSRIVETAISEGTLVCRKSRYYLTDCGRLTPRLTC